MPFRDLREYMAFLGERGELKRIETQVSRELEITEIADRVVKQGGPALLFDNVRDYSVPVFINMFGTEARTAAALGVGQLDDLGRRIEKYLGLAQGPLPSSMFDKLKTLGQLAEFASYAPRVIESPPCQEVVLDPPTLAPFPVLKCWPRDGGPFITLPLVITRDPATGQRNVGMYRLQVYDDRTTGMHWHLHKGGAQHYRASEAEAKRLEVAVAIGTDPATTYAASAPLPSGIDELFFAGFLRRERVELARCLTVDLEVPAHSEIVLEGYVDPRERRVEGPFGDHTGFYSAADEYPVFHITRVTHRRDPIYAATIVGRPVMEDYYLGKATERMFLPLIKFMLPEVVDVSMPPEGVFHNLVVVSIRKQYPGHARKVVYGLWGLMLMALTKNIVVVDEDVDVQNWSEMAWRVLNNVEPRRDLVLADGPLDALDHAAPLAHYGGKLGIDATRKGASEGHDREWPADIVMDPEIVRLVDRKWKELGF
ncbi:MAG: menaquinone biosynthesis decarboxylase [Dehalococcoidales bacterium]|nr:menaquinone biosynthesis decarboxylase [Dehalococcoidales bacterium]